MNPNLIASREEALALVDADLITIGDYVVLCRIKDWGLTGDPAAPALTEPTKPAARNAHSRPQDADALRPPDQRPAPVSEAFRREMAVPTRGQIHCLSIRSA
ncbi:hypothetical protein [Methylobacterium sp. R2-1]|uniref:hypothetical protein n=1 Tax=Methylobacterium sp. R2-1 TaxID=2587064 RepID=UPI0017E01F59|nr:hypothetical protein [Methylobacterium sp. R2-1]MBB2963113.1 hypothetical protein [Methylobacterium sp. R2-1]